jgi:hypothetical protein
MGIIIIVPGENSPVRIGRVVTFVVPAKAVMDVHLNVRNAQQGGFNHMKALHRASK